MPSTSSQSKKINEGDKNLNDEKNKKNCDEKENPEMNISDIFDDDDDIIPPSPPEEMVYKKVTKAAKFKLSYEDISKKLPKTDVAELIDIIDGNANKPKERNGEETFLSELDKLRKKSKSHELAKNEPCRVEQNETMDIEEYVTYDSVSILNNTSEESKTSKRENNRLFSVEIIEIKLA
ncbi:hypothetical protein NQ314_001180 [Rhamnusium bicolor]|uniref:Uncharacterized protein n=1 Tax=Rhamnusium bicolor TaxID=1586634 RepID=A0AAV8ZU86_9CUCU|nr:hypothetical protein NQ314_001180 [Rhamnusium bicolor]